ncbi:MAG TPA: YdeI/OmpD-associated family protein [Candidatus Polarisedimenticolia bacterium]|jgi:uncharacterized protein YdeI (YjbR/CyaY-like superfamily)|nr:YdeI/OmpD-associated family protein [Candidatus Polarisedimenticolia bacterium]
MGRKDPRVDAYIEKSAVFARPILNHLREVVHAACPEVDETLKWGFPHFMHKGILCSMASFKQHCAFGFWKGTLLAEKHKGRAAIRETAMGEFGRITSLSDLPGEKALRRYVKDAVALNDAGVKLPRPKPKSGRSLRVPEDLQVALSKNRKARTIFEGFSPSHRREYVEWMTEAKTEATRRRRLETAVAWMAEGKVRNWKYLQK